MISLLIAAFIVWAAFSKFDEVSSASGQVVPSENVKTVQHLEGGIIEKISVREGAVVHPGDPLISLKLGTTVLNREELVARLEGHRLRRVRVMAEASDKPPVFPSDLVTKYRKLADAEQRTLKARRAELENSIAVFDRRADQARLAVRELEAKRRSLETELVLAKRKFGMSKSLLSEGLTSKLSHIEAERELRRLEGGRERLAASIPKAMAVKAEASQRIVEARSIFRRRALEELAGVEAQINQTKELLSEASAQAARTQIKSPIEGVVKKLNYHTIGGVVRPGAPIMEIVPSEDRLVVEARLNPNDRGYVQEGQPAVVKISTYDFIRYGGLSGTVKHIAPGSDATKGGEPYFRVVVETDKPYLGDRAGTLDILPGMEATVDIHTGQRSVLEYFLRPVLKLKSEAFRER
ncbi:MAG: HlyD family type I secretion periplasmic adaptor subunit [Alphaproteobacteria bacterium]|nr:HlyD family type I secretion periplasmic adaptor subunit [Alphaproteobacteria bacterium]